MNAVRDKVVATTSGLFSTVRSRWLTDPPLSPPVKLGYRALLSAAVETVPERIRSIIGLEADGAPIGRRAVPALRWALGSSPAWHVSLIPTGAPVPPGLFRQPLDIDEG